MRIMTRAETEDAHESRCFNSLRSSSNAGEPDVVDPWRRASRAAALSAAAAIPTAACVSRVWIATINPGVVWKEDVGAAENRSAVLRSPWLFFLVLREGCSSSGGGDADRPVLERSSSTGEGGPSLAQTSAGRVKSETVFFDPPLERAAASCTWAVYSCGV